MERTITMKSPYNRLVSIVIHECKDLEDEDLAGALQLCAICLLYTLLPPRLTHSHHNAGKSDPYVTIQFPDADDVLSAMDGGETAKTSVVQDNLDPKVRGEVNTDVPRCTALGMCSRSFSRSSPF